MYTFGGLMKCRKSGRWAVLSWVVAFSVAGMIFSAWMLDSVDRGRGCEAFNRRGKNGESGHPLRAPEVLFVESAGSARISVRAACSIESAARHHHRAHVTLHHVAPLSRDSILNTLLATLPNFRLRQLNLTQLFHHTPLRQWHEEGRHLRSWYPTEKLSDAVRYALLWHRGGIYLDTDVIVLRSMRHLQDAVGLENAFGVNGAVLVFQRNSSHLFRLMEQLLEDWSDARWGTEGPILLTKFLRRMCAVGGDTGNSHRSDIRHQSGIQQKSDIQQQSDIYNQSVIPHLSGIQQSSIQQSGIQQSGIQQKSDILHQSGIRHQSGIQQQSDIQHRTGNPRSRPGKPSSVSVLFNYAMDPASCGGVTILPYHSFYPVPWPLWPTFYSVVHDWRHLLGCSYTVHLWNSMSKGRHSTVGSRELLDVLARRNCPAIYNLVLLEGASL